jgi:hypothetical protein
MSPFRLNTLVLRLAALGLTAGFALAQTAAFAAPAEPTDAAKPAAEVKADTVRPPIFKALQGLPELIKAKKYKEAYEKVDEADRTPDKTPYESFIINRNRGAVAVGAGDTAIAGKAIEAVIEAKRLPPAEQLSYMLALGGMYYNVKDYPNTVKWLKRYAAEGGTDPQGNTVLAQAYYLNNDFANAYKLLSAELAATEKAGKVPTELQYQLLLNSAVKTNNKPAFAPILEKLVTHYPTRDYWNDFLQSRRIKAAYPESALLDFYRLKLALGIKLEGDEIMDMAELAMHAGLPAEAKKVLDTGFQSGLLGKGKDAKAEKKLFDQATKGAADDLKTMATGEASAQKAKDGLGLVNLGYAFVSSGQFDKGIALMEEGIRKGVAKRPTEAKLHLGEAYFLAGRKPEALAVFQTIQDKDATGDFARYWTMSLNHPASK